MALQKLNLDKIIPLSVIWIARYSAAIYIVKGNIGGDYFELDELSHLVIDRKSYDILRIIDRKVGLRNIRNFSLNIN
jgi:hypothetical protein